MFLTNKFAQDNLFKSASCPICELLSCMQDVCAQTIFLILSESCCHFQVFNYFSQYSRLLDVNTLLTNIFLGINVFTHVFPGFDL